MPPVVDQLRYGFGARIGSGGGGGAITGGGGGAGAT
jgi:hypothetical protein